MFGSKKIACNTAFQSFFHWLNGIIPPNGRIRFMPDSNYRHGNENKQFYCLIKPPSAIV
jgi:hypothetical protein